MRAGWIRLLCAAKILFPDLPSLGSAKKQKKCEENETLAQRRSVTHQNKMFVADCGKCETATYMCKQLSVDVFPRWVCNVCVCVCAVGERWVAVRVDRDPEQPAQMGSSTCSLYVKDLLP